MHLVTSRTNSPQLHPKLLENNYSLETSDIRPRKTFTSLQPFSNFRGEMSLGGLSLPNQNFSFRHEDNCVIFQNHPVNSFPNIEIVLEKKKSKLEIKEFKVERSDNSVQGELLYTRLFLMLSEIRRCFLFIKNINLPPFNFSFGELSSEESDKMLHRAKLSRKLRFLELFFKTKFNLPEEFDANDIRQIEVLFRGLLEGEFSIPIDASITIFNYKPSKNDLQNTSVSQKRAFTFELNDDLLVLDKFFSIGKMTAKIKKGSIANPRIFKNYRKDEVVPSVQSSLN